MRVIVGITGATGIIYGIRLLEELRRAAVETHLIMSEWGERTVRIETEYAPATVRALATVTYRDDNQAAPISSGSFPCDAMIVIPCSGKSLAAIAQGLSFSLIHRAAEVTLKERRKLVLCPRETPLSTIHLENMLKVSRAGAIVAPPMPAFYGHPQHLDDLVTHTVGRLLDVLGVPNELPHRWGVRESE